MSSNNANNLTQKTVSGVMWKFAERIGAQMVTLIISIVLARILMPDDYGIIAIVTIFITLCNVFVTHGFGASLIQKKDADELDFSSIFYVSLVISLFLYAIIFFTAPLIADFYGNELISPILRVMGIRLPIASVNSIQQAYVSRKMQFKKFFFATLGATLVSGAVGIYMAYSGFGVWALVAQYLINVFLSTLILVFVVRWFPKLVFSFKRVKTLFSYGWKLLVSGLVDTGYKELRSLVIAKKYTSTDLAYYDKGRQFPNLISTNVNASLDTVLFSAMSKVQDDRSKVKAITRKSIKTGAFLVMPCLFGLAAVANTFVKIILTDKWLPAVPYIQIMCFVYAFWPIHTANLQAIKAVGRTDLFLILEVIKKSVGIISLLISMWFGVIWIAFTEILTTVISSLINAYPNKKLLEYSYLEQLKDLIPYILASLFMAITVYLVGLINMNIYLLFIIQLVIGVAIYVFISYIFKFEAFNFILSFIKSKFKRNKNNQTI